ncbi:MAG TPA: molybdopterin oxidoreductase, partial [Ignavibacteria bacterium]|nr:molybdopterin oxidoreductase [Ignavibacteria bacterium]
MNSGKVGVVMHFDTNPVYHLPMELGYTEALSKVDLSLTFCHTANETSVISNYTLPIHHDLESWNDFKTRDNVYSLQQPVIAPLFDSRQKEAALLRWINDIDEYTEDIYHKYLMNNFKEKIYSKFDTPTDFKTFWYTALHDGVLELKNNSSSLSFNGNSLNNIKVENNNAITLHLQKNYFIGDGRFANNGWLQETPHPVSKIAWDNYAALSPSTASKLSIENDDV